MARRTKADAQATRSGLLDAAEQLFEARGVSRTSLNDIAVAAGATVVFVSHELDRAAAVAHRTVPLAGGMAGGASDGTADGAGAAAGGADESSSAPVLGSVS